MTIRSLIIRHEGVRLVAYTDSVGHWTVGVGHNCDAWPLDPDQWEGDGVISPETCDDLLSADIARCMGPLVAACTPWFQTLDPVRQAVLVDMAFNLGPEKLLTWHHTIGCVAAGDYEGAATNMMASEPWASQVGKRATELASMMRSGEWPA